jgi:hypothetical protein
VLPGLDADTASSYLVNMTLINCSSCHDQVSDSRCSDAVDFFAHTFGRVCQFCTPIVKRQLNALCVLHGGVILAGQVMDLPVDCPEITSCDHLAELTREVVAFVRPANFTKVRQYLDYLGLPFTERSPGVFVMSKDVVRDFEETGCVGGRPVHLLGPCLLRAFRDLTVTVSQDIDREIYTLNYLPREPRVLSTKLPAVSLPPIEALVAA